MIYAYHFSLVAAQIVVHRFSGDDAVAVVFKIACVLSTSPGPRPLVSAHLAEDRKFGSPK